MKKRVNPKPKKSTRMSYATYVFLSQRLEEARAKIHNEYVIACDFIPKANIDDAIQVLNQKMARLSQMEEELYQVIAETYRDHPNPGMREFWGLT